MEKRKNPESNPLYLKFKVNGNTYETEALYRNFHNGCGHTLTNVLTFQCMYLPECPYCIGIFIDTDGQFYLLDIAQADWEQQRMSLSIKSNGQQESIRSMPIGSFSVSHDESLLDLILWNGGAYFRPIHFERTGNSIYQRIESENRLEDIQVNGRELFGVIYSSSVPEPFLVFKQPVSHIDLDISLF